jgi:hypothetical protein
MTYKHGDPWMICQRTGIKTRRSKMRKEWNGLWVAQDVWEPRHPQDFVKNVKDDSSVHPSFPDIKQAIGTTTLNGALVKGDLTATLTSVAGLVDGDAIGFEHNDGDTVFWTYINGDLAGSVATLGSPIPWGIDTGNTVYLPSLNNETWAATVGA